MRDKASSSSDPAKLTGGCACGAVRFRVTGSPRRAGLCHCLTCRKAHAAAFNPFVVFAAEQVEVEGATTVWESSPGYERRFCERCGSRVVNLNGPEIELSAGSFDEPGRFRPEYESWILRREPWLRPLEVPQHCQDRNPTCAPTQAGQEPSATRVV